MRWFFESEGYNMIAAKDGLEAVELYQKHKEKIAVVVLDLGLPKLGGWEALQQMREIQPDVKALIATGLLLPEVEAEMAQANPLARSDEALSTRRCACENRPRSSKRAQR